MMGFLIISLSEEYSMFFMFAPGTKVIKIRHYKGGGIFLVFAQDDDAVNKS